MTTYILLSCCVVAACLVTCNKVGGIRKWLGYYVFMDVFFTIALLWAFNGTFTGMIVATMSGLLMALVLSALRAILGYERVRFTKSGPVWESYDAAWNPKRPKMPKINISWEYK